MSVSVQQFEDGLAIHVRRNIEPGDVQDGGGQIDVQHDVRVAEKSHRCNKRWSIKAEKKREFK